MSPQPRAIYIGDTEQKRAQPSVTGRFVRLLGEPFYQIQHYDAMEPFFISVASCSDLWLFVASTGGVSAGRVNADQAIFPYYTVDRLTENNENTGHKAVLLVDAGDRRQLWEPFSDHHAGVYAVERNLYKNMTGTALVFEEINHPLGLTYRYAWRASERFGWVKSAWLANHTAGVMHVELLDGVQNILPANVQTLTQNTFSSLLDAYKRSELNPANGLGLFALNSTLTDLAEPSESLLATTVAQVGLDADAYLLSSAQLDDFRAGKGITTESEVRGRRGAYFAHACIDLPAGGERGWHFIIDTRQDAAAIVETIRWLGGERDSRCQDVEADIAANQAQLWAIVSGADGLQASENRILSDHHFANVMFNVMRGGIFMDQYWIHASDLVSFLKTRNRPVLEAHASFFASMPDKLLLSDLLARAEASGSPALVRLCYAYLPLSFSRRHGDPSRPWNRFAIQLKQPDGSRKLDYEGNWRDIFQNWEALAYAYPEYVESMISTFLNATTVDGYNPYRITHHGLDWEVPEPGNPWANIGYWSDHQIIYLQKLLEISAAFHPGKLRGFLDRPLFSYANVPYRIKPYADLLNDPYASIQFDWALERETEARLSQVGTDARLVRNRDGQVLQVSLAEKLLTLLLAKLVNFVPEGGIWMNTQRPEWNDANNALVGKGLSVVTVCYLRRFVAFCQGFIENEAPETLQVSVEVRRLFDQIAAILERNRPVLAGSFSDHQRRAMMDALGQAGSQYRWDYYEHGLSGGSAELSKAEMAQFLQQVQAYIDHTLRANRRSDQLYHAYNVLSLSAGSAHVGHLYEMLEGQVAMLSSGLLDAQESLALLESLRHSALYQGSQHSYILYPDRDVPGFLQKNCIPSQQLAGLSLPRMLVEDGERSLLVQDANGDYHFSGHIRNVKDVNRALDSLRGNPRYAPGVDSEAARIRELFEDVFRHNEFTGRSSTFFAYEGLGSVYWHMVAKLLLAAQETATRFHDSDCAEALQARYLDIRQGLGFNKTPADYGAFPTDPYSHTPKGQGAKQPGMTGLVKEEILARQVELGYSVANGELVFDLRLFDRGELLSQPIEYKYLDVAMQPQSLALQAGSFAYTICQTPVILSGALDKPGISIYFNDGSHRHVDSHTLDRDSSGHIFARDGKIHHLLVSVERQPS